MAATETQAPPPFASVVSRVSSDTVQRAINGLLKWRRSKSKTQKPQLLDQDDDFIYLILTLKKIPPKGRTNAHKIPIPHPLLSSSAELCLIIDDRPYSKLTSEAAKKKLMAENIPVSKVIKLSKLKSDYRPFEAKRKLCDSYDLFFADSRVIPLLPKLLGKQFFKKKKIPLPVDLRHKNWKEQIERACSSALLYLKTGTCSVVRVGKTSMEGGEVAENVVAAIDGVVESVPKKWAGVRSFHLKLSESLALPIYQAIPDVLLKIEGVKNLGESPVEVVNEVEKLERENVGLKNKEKKKEKKKGGRIHEVRYMDGEVGEYEDELGDVEDIEGEKSENDDVGGPEFGGKKRKKGDSVIRVKKLKKSASKAGKGEEMDDVEDIGGEKSENDDVGGSEFGGKKTKKRDSVIRVKRLKKSASKAGKGEEMDDVEDIGGEKSENDDVGGSESGGKKRKKGDSVVPVKRSKKSAAKAGKGEECGDKEVRKKGRVGGLKDGESKVKHKKNKKTQ